MSQAAPNTAAAPGRPGRCLYLDLLRCLSIAGVVFMHSSSPLMGGPTDQAVWAGVGYSALSLFCVPALLMISGALMLGDTRPMSLKAFYGRRFVKIALPLLAWSVIYYLLTCYQQGVTPHLGSFLKRFLTGMWAGPLWFLYMIAGVYLMLPFIRPAFSGRDKGPAVVFVCIVFGASTLNFATRLIWAQELNTFFSGAIIPYYFGHFVLGHLLNTTDVRVPGGKLTLVLAFAACAAASTVGEYAALRDPSMLRNTFFSYQQPLAAVMAASAFLFLKDWKPGPERRRARFIQELSSLSYGIFLTHFLALMLLTGQLPLFFAPGQGLDWNTVNPWVGPLLLGAAVFTLSTLFTAALKRTPYLERIVP